MSAAPASWAKEPFLLTPVFLTRAQSDVPIDEALIVAIENPKDRMKVLQLEDQMLRFAQNPQKEQLELPALSSFMRLIVHRMAARFWLDHEAVEPREETAADAPLAIILYKNRDTTIPRNLLIHIKPKGVPQSERLTSAVGAS